MIFEMIPDCLHNSPTWFSVVRDSPVASPCLLCTGWWHARFPRSRHALAADVGSSNPEKRQKTTSCRRAEMIRSFTHTQTSKQNAIKTCQVMYCNVTDTISWWDHHDRVMQLNWLHFCGICQMMPLKVWPNTALGCNHQSICMPKLQPLSSAALVSNVLPWKDEGSSKPCAVIEALKYIGPHSGFEPGRPDSKS